MDSAFLTVAGWRASGVYRRSPLAGAFVPAELECVPMTQPQEYAQASLFERPCAAPVLVSLSQRYQILAELVRGLRAHVGQPGCMLVRLYGPDFNVALPAELLEADVLLVHDPLAALPSVLAAGRDNIVLIEQSLRADGVEQGDNALAITLLRPADASSAAAFRQWSAQAPLLRALDAFCVGEVLIEVPAASDIALEARA